MNKELVLSQTPLTLSELAEFAFHRSHFKSVVVDSESRERVDQCHRRLALLLEKGQAIYGVTTGFGDSSFRLIPAHQTELLQSNLVSYLLCGTGPRLSIEASRATMVIRTKSFCRGYSGVSFELVERMREFTERDWVPVIPREGSLGASGDLIPLAYLAQVLQGEGEIYCGGKIRMTRDVLKENGVAPYKLKVKEGLALVNGTSAMAGLALTNIVKANRLIELATIGTAWNVMALKGRIESFGKLVNQQANRHTGQSYAASRIATLLHDEFYTGNSQTPDVGNRQSQVDTQVQDRYSLRCFPQIMGPILDTILLVEKWIETEINGVSDNPLIDEDAQLATGGNFYGGYLSHGMDYLKICLANLADMIDRQLMLVIDEKTNRGLPPNLAAWNEIPEEQRFLHHGLKGLHQATSAITSEIMARANPCSTHSRSSESHNQDKVSLGMSAAVQTSEMIEQLSTITAMYLACVAQALDLRGIKLKGARSKELYGLVRETVPFVIQDIPLDQPILKLRKKLFSEEAI